MSKKYYIFLLVLMSFSTSSKKSYDKIFPDDFNSAIKFIAQNKNKFNNLATKNQQSAILMRAIVFPEIMRFSVLSDILETSALELLYANFGTKAADFSIGVFQMKPSFVESIEREIETCNDLKKLYSHLLFSANYTEEQKRKERVCRLKNTEWGLNYLSAFIAVCDKKYKNEYFENEDEKVIFYSTAYNSGFYNTPEKIRSYSKLKFYPYGAKYKGEQYPYSDVSLFYYNREIKK
jgi:hypothetical protein